MGLRFLGGVFFVILVLGYALHLTGAAIVALTVYVGGAAIVLVVIGKVISGGRRR